MNTKRSPRLKHPYSADRPIDSKKEDVLKRAKFAEHLADDLRSWDGADSLVVGLYGDWGAGKSSVKNMLVEAIQRHRQSAHAVMEFNPWQLSGSGNIPAAFFRELGVVLRKEGPARDIKKRAAKLNVYAGLLTVGGTIAGSVGVVRTFLAGPDGPVLVAAGAGMKAAGSAAKVGAEALAAKAEADKKGLQELKTELADLMAALPRPILVIIDDMDRLTDDEIRQVIQLVKANADFPRLVFLLLFQRDVVAKALDVITGNRGVEFLEKIIQVGFHVPHASSAAVQKTLFDGLNAHLANEAVSKRWDKRRWSDLFMDGIAGYFRNLRHVKRFLASFDFHIRQHKSPGSFEVNPVDLIGLETLRVFEPGVYERLPSAKVILTRHTQSSWLGEIKQDVIEAGIDQIISGAASETRERVKSILEVLFPPISSAYSKRGGAAGRHQEWLTELRVCHPDMFDKYFTLAVADNDLSQAELDALLLAAGDTNAFVTASKALIERGLLKIAFERLDAYKEKIAVDHMPSLLRALCDLGDNFPEREPGFLAADLSVFASRLCYFGLQREPDKQRRFDILKEAISASQGVALPFALVQLEERNEEAKSRGHEFLIDEGNVAPLKEICIQKFRNVLKHNAFLNSPQFRITLFRWIAWETPSHAKALIHDKIRTSADAIWFLNAIMDESHSYGHEHKVHYSMRLTFLERLTDVAHVQNLLKDVKPSSLTKRQKIAVREFNKALKRRAEGKPDVIDSGFDDPDAEAVD